MRHPDFDRCQALAHARCAELVAAGIAAVVCYGRYRPSEPEATWDERWSGLAAAYPSARTHGFAHYWVATPSELIDPSSGQFGGPPERRLPLTEAVAAGYDETGRLVPAVSA